MTASLNHETGTDSKSSPWAESVLDEIRSAQYPSQLRHRGPEIAKAAAAGLIQADEIDVIFNALASRRNELSVPNNVEPPVDPPETTLTTEEWSPTKILDSLPQTPRELDWAERQLPNGDRD